MEPLVFARAPSPSPAIPAAIVSLPVSPKPERPTLAAVFQSEESGLLRFAICLDTQQLG